MQIRSHIRPKTPTDRPQVPRQSIIPSLQYKHNQHHHNTKANTRSPNNIPTFSNQYRRAKVHRVLNRKNTISYPLIKLLQLRVRSWQTRLPTKNIHIQHKQHTRRINSPTTNYEYRQPTTTTHRPLTIQNTIHTRTSQPHHRNIQRRTFQRRSQRSRNHRSTLQEHRRNHHRQYRQRSRQVIRVQRKSIIQLRSTNREYNSIRLRPSTTSGSHLIPRATRQARRQYTKTTTPSSQGLMPSLATKFGQQAKRRSPAFHKRPS